jgi:4-amino-4-deoxy-L-arabinose transferase-like glycosyltransferase
MNTVISGLLKPRYLFLIILLLLSAYLRLYRISDYMTFLGDEGRDVLIVKRMIIDHKFTLLGPTASVGGFFLGPIYYYFMIPFLWAWNLDPVGPAIMVALFGIATVYLLYITGKNLISEYAGFSAASLYALSPIIIAYSRSSWNPNIVPFFSMILIYSLWKASVTEKTKWLLVSGIALGIGIQLHYLFVFLFILTFVWLFFLYCSNKIRKLRSYLGLVMGFIIGNSLFLLFEIRHGFPNTKSIIQFILTGKDTGFNVYYFFNTIGFVIYRLFGRFLVRLPEDQMLINYPVVVSELWKLSVYLIIGLCIFVYIYYYKQLSIFLFREKSKNHIKIIATYSQYYGIILLGLWFLVTIVLFGFYKRGIYDYYFGIIFPLPFLLVGLALDKLSKPGFRQFLSYGILVFLLVFNWFGRPFIYAPNRQLDQTKTIAKVAFDKAGGKPFNFALLAGSNTDHAYRYFFEIWGNSPKTIDVLANDPDRKSVTDQLIVACEESDCKPLGHPLWEIAGFGRAEIVGQWDVSFVKIYKLVHYSENK